MNTTEPQDKNMYFGDLISDIEIQFLVKISYEHLTIIMEELSEYRNSYAFDKYPVKLLWYKIAEIIKRTEWIAQSIESITPKDKQDALERLFNYVEAFYIDGGNADKMLETIIQDWQHNRTLFLPEQYNQEITPRLGATCYDKCGNENVSNNLYNAMVYENLYIQNLLDNMNSYFTKSNHIQFNSRTGEVLFRRAKGIICEPGSIQFFILKKLFRHKNHRMLVSKIAETLNGLLQKKEDEKRKKQIEAGKSVGKAIIVDVARRKTLYNAKDEINKKFREIFAVDFDLLEIDGKYYVLAKGLIIEYE